MRSSVTLRIGEVVVAVSGRELEIDVPVGSGAAVVEKTVPALDHGSRPIDVVFDMLGGNAEIARYLSVGASTVSEMRRRASVPAKYFLAFERLAAARGILDVVNVRRLAELHDVYSSEISGEQTSSGAAFP